MILQGAFTAEFFLIYRLFGALNDGLSNLFPFGKGKFGSLLPILFTLLVFLVEFIDKSEDIRNAMFSILHGWLSQIALHRLIVGELEDKGWQLLEAEEEVALGVISLVDEVHYR